MEPATRDLLQEIVRRESRSLLSYVGDAFPWTTHKGDHALARLQQIVAAEREATAELGRFLTRRRLPLAYIGAYPSNFTTLNYMGLRHVLTRLVVWEKKSIRELEYDLSALRGDAEAKALVEKMLALKRKHRETLEVLAAEQTPATVN